MGGYSVVGNGSGVTRIGKNAFCGCMSLTSIVIPEGVSIIDDYTFSTCTELTSVVFERPNVWMVDGEKLTGLSDPATAAQYLTYTYSFCL